MGCRPLAALALCAMAGCVAQQTGQSGPTLGGDQRSAGLDVPLTASGMPSADNLSLAGLFAALPLPIAQLSCPSSLCTEARSAWLPSGELLVGFSIESVAEPIPVDVSFVLDASGSVAGSEDVRAATVEVALDHLDADDTLGVWAFTGVSEELVASASVDDAHRTEVRRALRTLDALPTVTASLPEICMAWDDVLEWLNESEEASHEDGDPLDTADTGGFVDTGHAPPGPAPVAVARWVEDVLQSANDNLGPALLSLGCTQGSAVREGAEASLASLPEGTASRVSRMVLVSDLDGELPTEAVFDAAELGIGTSVLGVTSATDRVAMAQLAAAPGAHMLDASEPAAALVAWESRFDSWMSPTSWGLGIELTEASSTHYTLVRRLGTTDLEQLGANAVFAGSGHGMLAVLLEPTTLPAVQPQFQITSNSVTRDTETVHSWAKVPNRLLVSSWGEGDDLVALDLAWRVALWEAIETQDQGRWEALLLEHENWEADYGSSEPQQ